MGEAASYRPSHMALMSPNGSYCGLRRAYNHVLLNWYKTSRPLGDVITRPDRCRVTTHWRGEGGAEWGSFMLRTLDLSRAGFALAAQKIKQQSHQSG